MGWGAELTAASLRGGALLSTHPLRLAAVCCAGGFSVVLGTRIKVQCGACDAELVMHDWQDHAPKGTSTNSNLFNYYIKHLDRRHGARVPTPRGIAPSVVGAGNSTKAAAVPSRPNKRPAEELPRPDTRHKAGHVRAATQR